MGLRNLSGFVGEGFIHSICDGRSDLRKNPHPDGYPDILIMDDVGLSCLGEGVQDKSKFSPFISGGFEVKATCGNVGPHGSKEYRGRRHATRFEWKAHHQQTNHLIGILWDFIEESPTILSVFYAGNLTSDDWGSIVIPKDNGSRTTSVSVMRRSGVNKMMACPILQMTPPNRDDRPSMGDFEK